MSSQKHRTSTDTKSVLRAASIGDHSNDAASVKDKKKGVSFLSRILAPSKLKPKMDETDDNHDDDNASELRPEGLNAELFSQSADNIGFNPRYPQPPGYIKVRVKYKKESAFDRIFLAQELRHGRPNLLPQKNERAAQARGEHLSATPSASPDLGSSRRASSDTGTDAIWAMEFSHDGKYLAAAGQDKVVRVWAVITSQEDRRAHEREEEAAHGKAEGSQQRLSAPVFRRNPMREFEGHTSTVLDLSWSKNNFLLSSSFDKTVRLWHVSRNECLVTFKHAEYCSSICFHPRDDRFFLAGSLDTKLRLWSIPDKSVAFWNQLPEMITAVSFTPDGKTAIAGTMGGSCFFYDTEGLKSKTQINIKPSGRNVKPAKITGIKTIDWTEIGSGSSTPNLAGGISPSNSLKRDVKVLISSNDSRVRLYNFRDKSLEMKFKSHKNVASQIRASFSDDSRFVISGSEDRKTYIWSTAAIQEGEKQRAVELFEAHSSMTTGALLAPRKLRVALSASEDPVYDLCNPPPVTLVSRSESVRTGSNVSGILQNGGVVASDDQLDVPDKNGKGYANTERTEEQARRVEESPAYIARAGHPGGHILVTADYSGNIKVFRQDCAHAKRRADTWSDGASMFSRPSRRIANSVNGNSGLGRSRANASKGSVAGSVSSSRSRAGSVATQPPGERILSWRQDVSGNTFATSGGGDSGGSAMRSVAAKVGRNGSASPRRRFLGGTGTSVKRNGESSQPRDSGVAPDRSTGESHSRPKTPDAQPSQSTGTTEHTDMAHSPAADSGTELQLVASPEQMPGSDIGQKVARQSSTSPSALAEDGDSGNPLWLRGGRSYVFWNASAHGNRKSAGGQGKGSRAGGIPHSVVTSQPTTPGMELSQQASVVSKLSTERSDAGSDLSEAEDEGGGGGGFAGGEVKCNKCGSTSFRARMGHSESRQLVCQRCGTVS